MGRKMKTSGLGQFEIEKCIRHPLGDVKPLEVYTHTHAYI